MDKTPEQVIDELAQPFPVESLHFRVGAMTKNKDKAIALAYIDSRDAMKRLDAVVGAQNWQRRYPWSDGKRLYCEVGIRFGDEWIWKGDGAGDTQVEAEKGAFSDAFKRACVNWGIGQYLYDSPNEWWPVNNFKQFEAATISNIRHKFQSFQKAYFGNNAGGPFLAAVVECIEKDDTYTILDLAKKPEYQKVFGKLTTKQKSAVRELEQAGAKAVAAYAQTFKEAAQNNDVSALKEAMEEIDSAPLKRAIYSALDTDTQHFISTNKG